MTSPALVALSGRIATNTLTLSDQAALTTALNVVAQTFLGPDETSSVRFSDEAEAREWIAALYTIAASGVGGGGIVASGTIIVGSASAATALPVTGLSVGQPLVIDSFGAEFSLQPIDGMTVDGVTVIASSSGSFVWERGDTLVAVQSQLATAWFVNTATGNDENTGASSGQALKHKAEIVRRWGTSSPTLDGITVTITYAGAPIDDTDPGIFTPILVNGATLIHTAALPAAGFTGTLNVVTPKNRAGNTALHASFNTTTGAIADFMLLVNATRGNSRAWVVSGGPTFLLSQPLAPYVAGTDATVPTEVDTWASGDAISGYVLLAVDLAEIGGTTPNFAAGNAPQHLVQQIQIVDPSGNGSALQVDGPGNVAIVESIQGRPPSVNSTWAFTTFLNCANVATMSGVSAVPLNWSIRAGFCSNIGAYGSGCLVDNDLVVAGASSVQGESISAGKVYLDTGSRFLPLGGLAAIAGPLYGSGSLNVEDGSCDYSAPAATSLPLSGGIMIGSNTSAYSNSTTGGLTTVHLVTLTAAHLDATPSGAAAFGGLAFVPGVGALTAGAVTP